MSNRDEIDEARDVYLNLIKAHERLTGEFAALFKAHGLTQAWFNTLRILIGAPKGGVPCQYIGERLLNRLPDVTRLVDRMEAAGLVERERSDEDRRVVHVKVTRKGRTVCEKLRAPVEALHASQVAHLGASQIRTLNKGLERLVEAP